MVVLLVSMLPLIGFVGLTCFFLGAQHGLNVAYEHMEKEGYSNENFGKN